MLPVTTLSTWAVVAGGQAVRGLVLSGLGWLLALPLLVSLEAGLIAISVAPVGWLLIGRISAEYLRKVAIVTTVESQAPYAAGVGTEREQFAI